MSSEFCSIKGNREGLVITITDSARFSAVLDALDRQLSSAESFFAGASAKVRVKRGTLDSEQLSLLEQLLSVYGMYLDREPPRDEPTVSETMGEDSRGGQGYEPDNTLLVRRTIRSGQSLHYDGNVVVLGDVNPGAEIVCSGDILVLGSLRGVAHAGAEGATGATVFAFRLEPTQLRIAHLISRAPDGQVPRPSVPEIARIVKNMIEVSIYNH